MAGPIALVSDVSTLILLAQLRNQEEGRARARRQGQPLITCFCQGYISNGDVMQVDFHTSVSQHQRMLIIQQGSHLLCETGIPIIASTLCDGKSNQS